VLSAFHLYNLLVLRRIVSHPAFWVALLALVVRLLPGVRTIDDAYITFRYAQNALSGEGLVYNAGEAVLGTTTPLFALSLAALQGLLGWTGLGFPQLAVFVNAIADSLTCALLIMLAARLRWPFAGLAAAMVWAVAPWSVTFAIGGMETSFFIALMLGTFYMFSLGRLTAAAVVGSLSLLSRPDALLFLLPLAVERIRQALPASRLNSRPTRLSWKEVAGFLAPLAIWSILGLAWYGSPIPQTISAKAFAYSLAPEAGLVRLLQHFGTPFVEQYTFGAGFLWVGVVLYPALFLLGGLSVWRSQKSSWPLFIYPALYFAAFAIANPLIFRWYLAPPLPFYFLGIFAGVERLARDVRGPQLAYLGLVVAVALSLRGWTLRPDHGPARPAPEMAYIRLELLYQDAAEWLRPRLDPGQVLAAGDIGALGFHTGAKILDTVGLVSPAASAYYPLPPEAYAINYAIPTDLILNFHPDWLVILEAYGRNTLLVDSRFLEQYQQVGVLATDIYGSDGMLIFKRIPGA
jgi:arabinofuranosyltransferase